jgi:SWI/SNF-related matrix-associated actin-dependent regulator 1 of chromatin subfamily A
MKNNMEKENKIFNLMKKHESLIEYLCEDLNDEQKDFNKNEFINNPEIRVFLANITAAGVGLTLTVSTKMVFSSFQYTYSDNLQMEDRIHRINQTKDVDIYYQIFRGTQYEKIWNTVMKKELAINH